MKARIDCPTCRKQIYKEVEKGFLQHEYKFFEDSARTFAIYAICGVLTTMIRRGRTKQYIKQMYDDMCMFFGASDVFGKTITMTDIMTRLEKEYDIDWNKLVIHLESEKKFITGEQKRKV